MFFLHLIEKQIKDSNENAHVQSVKTATTTTTTTTKNTTLIKFNAMYRREMELISINMDYCLLHFDGIEFFLGVRLHVGGGSLTNLNFFNVNPQI